MLHVLILIYLFIASGIVSKKLGFVRSCRMALGDLLVWDMIKLLLFKKQNEPFEATVVACWCTKGDSKKSAVSEVKKTPHSSVVWGCRC